MSLPLLWFRKAKLFFINGFLKDATSNAELNLRTCNRRVEFFVLDSAWVTFEEELERCEETSAKISH